MEMAEAVWPPRRVSLSYGCDTAIKRVQFRMQAKRCSLVLVWKTVPCKLGWSMHRCMVLRGHVGNLTMAVKC